MKVKLGEKSSFSLSLLKYIVDKSDFDLACTRGKGHHKIYGSDLRSPDCKTYWMKLNIIDIYICEIVSDKLSGRFSFFLSPCKGFLLFCTVQSRRHMNSQFQIRGCAALVNFCDMYLCFWLSFVTETKCDDRMHQFSEIPESRMAKMHRLLGSSGGQNWSV